MTDKLNATVEYVCITFDSAEQIDGFKKRLKLVDGENIVKTNGSTIFLNLPSVDIIYETIRCFC